MHKNDVTKRLLIITNPARARFFLAGTVVLRLPNASSAVDRPCVRHWRCWRAADGVRLERRRLCSRAVRRRVLERRRRPRRHCWWCVECVARVCVLLVPRRSPRFRRCLFHCLFPSLSSRTSFSFTPLALMHSLNTQSLVLQGRTGAPRQTWRSHSARA